MRLNNIEYRTYISFKGKTGYEIVYWYPNYLYNKQDLYIWDERIKMYKDPNNEYVRYSPECFNHPESCYVLAFIDFKNKEEPDVKTVGSRPFNLLPNEIDDFIKIIQDFYTNWKTLKEKLYEGKSNKFE